MPQNKEATENPTPELYQSNDAPILQSLIALFSGGGGGGIFGLVELSIKQPSSNS